MKPAPLLLLLAATLPALAPVQGAEGPTQRAAATPLDMHNSRNSLDWAGVYEGVLPCAGCPGIETRLTLANDGTFEQQSRQPDRDATPKTQQGRFSWQADGNTIVLDAAGSQRFAVGEGRLLLLNGDGTRPDWSAPNRVLTMVTPGTPQAGAGLNQVLEDHRWTLESATDGQDRRVDALFPPAGRPFAFTFSGSRLNVQGGCNSLRGSYEINAQRQLQAGQIASTMMACKPELMQADAALGALLAGPLGLELVAGAQPQLRLRTASSEVLVLRGEKTPEALYGAATIIFLEVDAERVKCTNPRSPETLCLRVRERRFDEQGLRVGTPGEWQTFYDSIDGYTHTPGYRNVLRVKRFARNPAPDDGAAAVYVLDLVVETEKMPK